MPGNASTAAAFQSGMGYADELLRHQRERKEALSDEDRRGKVDKMHSDAQAIQGSLSQLSKNDPQFAEKSAEFQRQLTNINHDLYQVYHPAHNPGVFEKDRDWLFDKMRGKKKPVAVNPDYNPATTKTPDATITPAAQPVTLPETPSYQTWDLAGREHPTATMAVPHAKGLVKPGNLPIWDRPTVKNADGTHSSELSIAIGEEQDGKEVQVLIPTVVDGKFLTPDGKMPPGPMPKKGEEATGAWKALFDEAIKHYKKTKEHLGIFDSEDNADAYADALHNRKPNQPGTPPSEPITLPSAPVTIPGTTKPNVRPAASAMTPQQRQKMAGWDQARAATARDVAAAGPSPEEQGEARGRAAVSTILGEYQGKLKLIDGLNVPQEEKTGLRNDLIDQLLFGATTGKNLKLYKLADGTNQWLDAMRPLPPGATAVATTNADTAKRADFEEYLEQHPEQRGHLTYETWLSEQRAPTSKFGIMVESYKRAHGIPAEQSLTPEQVAFINQQIALSGQAPSTTITNTLKQDANGFWVPVQESNRRVPGIGTILRDPSGPTQGAPPTSRGASPQRPPPPAGAPQPKPSAQPRAGAAPPQPRAAGGANASVKVGLPLFAAPNKDYTDTKTAYQAALDRSATMDQNYKDGLKGNQQAMLSMVANHIGMTLGSQKGARITRAVWDEAVQSAPWYEAKMAQFFHQESPGGDYVFDGWKSGVTLTAEQMNQMLDLAHQKVGILADHLGRLQDQLKLPRTVQSGDWTPPPGAPDASQYPNGHQLINKKTQQVVAVVRGGKWDKP
jgi:hypothetical protein